MNSPRSKRRSVGPQRGGHKRRLDGAGEQDACQSVVWGQGVPQMMGTAAPMGLDPSLCTRHRDPLWPQPLTLKKGWVLISSASRSPRPQALPRGTSGGARGRGQGFIQGSQPKHCPPAPSISDRSGEPRVTAWDPAAITF